MNYLLSTSILMRSVPPYIFMESEPGHEIEMIKLSSWEWFLLLSIVIIIIWLLLLYQVRSTGDDNFVIQSQEKQETVSEYYSGDDLSGVPGSNHEE